MKPGSARWLATIVAIAFGVAGCQDPAYQFAEDDPRAQRTPPPPELSPREKILKLRTDLIGSVYENLTISGTPVGDGVFEKIDDQGVTFRVDKGVAFLAWEDLPSEIQRNWGHDPNPPEVPEEVMVAEAESENAKAPEEKPVLVPVATLNVDPETKRRLRALEGKAKTLRNKIKHAYTTVEEAEIFLAELTTVYDAEDAKAAAMKEERVYARMRRSTCGG